MILKKSTSLSKIVKIAKKNWFLPKIAGSHIFFQTWSKTFFLANINSTILLQRIRLFRQELQNKISFFKKSKILNYLPKNLTSLLNLSFLFLTWYEKKHFFVKNCQIKIPRKVFLSKTAEISLFLIKFSENFAFLWQKFLLVKISDETSDFIEISTNT